jgi:hypothetical protein
LSRVRAFLGLTFDGGSVPSAYDMEHQKSATNKLFIAKKRHFYPHNPQNPIYLVNRRLTDHNARTSP